MDRPIERGGHAARADLDEVLATARRIQILDGSPADPRSFDERIVVSIDDRAGLEAFRVAARVVDGAGGFCFCLGDGVLEIERGDGTWTTITLHHGYSMRWARWKQDARLAAPRVFAELCSERGWHRYEDAMAEAAQRAVRAEADRDRWRSAIPAPLKAHIDTLTHPEMGNALPGSIERGKQLLVNGYGSEIEAVRALCRWYGSGAGPWSGYPSYEGFAEELLSSFKFKTIYEAIRATLDPTQLAGAARFCADSSFRDERRFLPPKVVEMLRAFVTRNGTADQIERFNGAFP